MIFKVRKSKEKFGGFRKNSPNDLIFMGSVEQFHERLVILFLELMILRYVK